MRNELVPKDRLSSIFLGSSVFLGWKKKGGNISGELRYSWKATEFNDKGLECSLLGRMLAQYGFGLQRFMNQALWHTIVISALRGPGHSRSSSVTQRPAWAT